MKLPIFRMFGFWAAVFTSRTPCCCATGPRASTTLLPTVSTIGTLSTLRSLLIAASEIFGSFLPSSSTIRIFLPPIHPPFSMSSSASWLPRMKYSPNCGIGPGDRAHRAVLELLLRHRRCRRPGGASAIRRPRTKRTTRPSPDDSLQTMGPPCAS